MSKPTIIIVAVIAAFLIIGYIFMQKYFNLLHETQMLTQSVNVSRDSATHFKTQSGLLAAQVTQQQYTLDQMKTMKLPELDEMKQTIKDLGIKINNVRSYTGTNTVTHEHITTKAKDSLIRDTIEVESIDYSNEYTEVKGYKDEDSTWHLDITTQDSLKFIGSIQHTGFLGLGKSHVTGTAEATNPNTKILGIRFIDAKPTHKFLWWEW